MLTPLAVDPSHPFPYISGLSLNLAVLVGDPDDEVQRFARVKVPNNVPRFVDGVAERGRGGVPAARGPDRRAPVVLFPGMDVVEHHLFRVTRNADFEVEEDRDEDLLQALERSSCAAGSGRRCGSRSPRTSTTRSLELLVSEIDVERTTCCGCPACST